MSKRPDPHIKYRIALKRFGETSTCWPEETVLRDPAIYFMAKHFGRSMMEVVADINHMYIESYSLPRSRELHLLDDADDLPELHDNTSSSKRRSSRPLKSASSKRKASWQLSMSTLHGRSWVPVGTFDSVTAAARCIGIIENDAGAPICLHIRVAADSGDDAETLGRLEHQGHLGRIYEILRLAR
jgi:hypothetical protein